MRLNFSSIFVLLSVLVAVLHGAGFHVSAYPPAAGRLAAGITIAMLCCFTMFEALIFREVNNSIYGAGAHQAQGISAHVRQDFCFGPNHSSACAMKFWIWPAQTSGMMSCGRLQGRREFLADVSHELKTPIFAMGFVHTVLDSGKGRQRHGRRHMNFCAKPRSLVPRHRAGSGISQLEKCCACVALRSGNWLRDVFEQLG
jgi:hypothetical protein